jgi:uncharacterized protein with FMN-binding domain
VALATLGSAAAIGGLIGAKALAGDAAPAATPSTGSSGSTPATPVTTPTSTGSPTARNGTYTGQAAATRYGDVQVEIDVTSGQIDDIRVIRYPAGNGRDQQINQQAIPRLIAEGLAAQSADVDTVSGATYTSEGHRQSLQSAIDKAGL